MGLFSLPRNPIAPAAQPMPGHDKAAGDETRQAFMVEMPTGRELVTRPGHPVSPFGAARHIMPYSARSGLSQSHLTQVIIDALTGSKSASEAPALNEFTVLGLPLVWRCVRAKADAMRSMPFRVVKRVKFDEYETKENHPLTYLLNVSPDDEMDAGAYKAALVQHFELWGNFYTNAQFSSKGPIKRLQMMLPLETTLRRQDGVLLYDWSDGVNHAKGMEPWQVVHGRNQVFDGVIGLPPITLLRESLGVPHAAAQFAGKFLRNMARPSVIVTYKGRMKDQQQAQDYVKEMLEPVSGDKTGGAAVAFDEADVKTLTMPLEDAQFIETWEGTGYDVCRIFSVNPWKAYIKGGANYASATQASLDWLTDGLMPLITVFEQTFGWRCLTGGLELQALDEDLLRGDMQTMMQSYGLARQWGLLTPNEIRRKMGMQGVEGGDTMLVPANQITLEKAQAQDAGEGAAAPGNEGSQNVTNQLRSRVDIVTDLTAAARELLEPHVKTLAGIEADRLGKVRGAADEVRSVAKFWEEYQERASDRIAPVVRGIAKICHAAGVAVVPESKLGEVTRACVLRLMAMGQKSEQTAVSGSGEAQQAAVSLRVSAAAATVTGMLLA